MVQSHIIFLIFLISHTMPSKNTLKQILNPASPDFAWHVLQLQISLSTLNTSERPAVEDIMALIQLYMRAVEVLEEHADQRYLYFNNKIYALMVRKEVIEQLHRDAVGESGRKEAMEMAQRRQRELKKAQMDLQMYLQKESYTMSSVKDLLKRQQKVQIKRTQSIRRGLQHQKDTLEERIQHRRLRSNSKGTSNSKGKKQQEPNVVVLSSKTYGTRVQDPKKEKGLNDVKKNR